MNQDNTALVLLGLFTFVIVVAGVLNYRLWKRHGAGAMRTADAARMQREANEALAAAANDLVSATKAAAPGRNIIPFKRPAQAGGELTWEQRVEIAELAQAAGYMDYMRGQKRANPSPKGTQAFVCWAIEYSAGEEIAKRRTSKRGPSHKGIAP